MFFQRYANAVTRHPKLSLVLSAVLFLLFVFLARDVRLNNHFAALFSIDNEDNAYREFYREVFGADDGLLMAIVQLPDDDATAMNQVFFSHLEVAVEKLEQTGNYNRVLSPVSTSVIRAGEDDEIIIDPLFADDDISDAMRLTLLRESPATGGRLVSIDHNTVAVIAEMPTDFDRFRKIQEPAEYFRSTMNEAFADMPTVSVQFAGIPFTRIGILELMLRDLFLLVPLTALIVGLVSFLIFRSYAVVWITLLTTMFGLAATVGMMGINGDDVNQLTITFPVLLMVIIVANSTHFYHRYFRERQFGADQQTAVSIVTTRVGKAAFLSCLTTAIGFYALMTADMKILRSFGLYLGSGVLVSYIGMMLIIPACLMLAKPKTGNISTFTGKDWVSRCVAYSTSVRGRRWVTAAGVASLLGGGWLGYHIEYDYFLKDMLAPDHPQVVAGEVAEQKLSGALPLEVSLLGEPGAFKQADVLKKMRQTGDWLHAKGFGDHALSMADIVQSLNHAISGDNAIPDSNEAVAQLLLLAEGSSDAILEQLVNFDYSHARIRVNGSDLGADYLVTVKTEFNEYTETLFAGTGVKARMTGEAPVAYEGMNKLSRELLESVLMALVFIVITIQLVFRDWRLSLGSVFPNILPVILGLAFYALSGQSLNPLPGIAFCIAIGIAVDDTVHLFARFNEELQAGKPRVQAIIDAVDEVKGALIISSGILTCGFLVFLISGFSWNRDLGWLGAALIVIALFADLVFTPAVLSFGDARKDKV
ncbi:Uncharacterised protein [BD1-7 clade bacterium]|uniref:SSD domain-containing protein n=1 Tax=BD1-7 clade bacterium TaxID=2029982 RepID=A0A5S9PQ40_9GAMM|nr:Uncharacterised protein [BD1-7 clade bacterium]